MRERLYNYRNKNYTLRELCAMYDNNLTPKTLSMRLKNGWDMDAAVETPLYGCFANQNKYEGKDLVVIFRNPIPSVFQSMQPTLNKKYIARKRRCMYLGMKAKPYYIITLENGKPLVVYPDEFKIISIIENTNQSISADTVGVPK